MEFNLTNALVLLIIVQSNLFTFYLISHPKGKKVSNLILAGITLCLGLHFTNMLITNLPYFRVIPQLNPIFGLLYGPLFYFYAQSLIYKNLDLKQLHFNIHLFVNMPLFSYAVFWIMDDYQHRLDNESLNSIITMPVLIQFSAYLVLAYRAILRYQRVLNNTRSSVDKINLSWLKYINAIMAIFVITVSVEYLVQVRFIQYFIVELIFGVILFMVMSFVYKGLRHPEFFAGIGAEDEVVTFESREVISKEKSATKYDLLHLQKYLVEEKPFLEPDLSLQQLAESLHLTPRYLSQLINQHLKQNFFELINHYRIEEAKERLLNPENRHLRINEIMYDVGFSSKSTFNHVFKKHTGVTPSQFRQNMD